MGNRTSQRRAAGRSRRRWRRSAVGVNHRRIAWLAGADAVQPVRRANRREDRLSETLHCDPTVAQLAGRSENRAAGTGEGPRGVLASRSGVALELAVRARRNRDARAPARTRPQSLGARRDGATSPLGPHTGDNITRDVRAGTGMSVGCARTHPFHIHGNRQALAVFVPERAIKRTITRHLPTSRTWVTRLTSSCTGAAPLETTRGQVVITGARGTEPAVRRLSEPERVAHGETNGPRERDQRSRALVTRG